MKRMISLLMAALMLTGLLTACGTSQSTEASSGKKLNIVATIFPQYDFARQIAGDHSEITMLLKPGAESHSFEPTPQDIKKIQSADLFIYTGGENDVWVDDILSSMGDKRPETLKLLDCVPTVNEEIVDGMEHEHEHEEDHHDDGEFEDSEVKDRALSDWAGDWQSVYPYLLDGTLDEVFHHKAEEEQDKTEQEYKEYYKTGFKTDVERIKIEGNRIRFYTNGKEASSDYAYKGYEILTYESGKKGVRYQFEATDADTAAPKYIQFSDHEIAPTDDLEHFHIYSGNDGFDTLLKEMDNWPTYFGSKLTGKEIAEEMIGHEHAHEHEEEPDEHVWTSPANAILIAEKIAALLKEKDPANAASYEKNSAAYVKELKALDESFRNVVSSGARKTVLFGDRFPFRYFADAYGLTYYAAFSGCSTETEASAATVAFLVNKVKEEELPVVFAIEFSNGKIADSVCDATGAKKLTLHSCHNVSADELANGATYLSIMQKNVEALREALN